MKVRLIIVAVAISTAASGADLKSDEIVSHSFSLVDNTTIEVYHLKKNDVAFAEIGKPLGPMTGFVCRWTIVDGRLVITDSKEFRQVFELVKRGEKYSKLRRQSGAVALFRVSIDDE